MKNMTENIYQNTHTLPEIHGSEATKFAFNQKQWEQLAESVCSKPEGRRNPPKDLEYDEYLKNGSREMTKHWDNTIEKIRQRKVAALKKKEEHKKAEGLPFD